MDGVLMLGFSFLVIGFLGFVVASIIVLLQVEELKKKDQNGRK